MPATRTWSEAWQFPSRPPDGWSANSTRQTFETSLRSAREARAARSERVPENFPAFDPELDDKVTFSVYALLAAGCSIAEQGERLEAASSLERGASLLQYVHGPLALASRESAFHVFVAAMAFYAAGHYSRAFIAIRSVEQQTIAARIIAAFLRKDVGPLIEALNEVLLGDGPEIADQQELDEWAVTHSIARAVSWRWSSFSPEWKVD